MIGWRGAVGLLKQAANEEIVTASCPVYRETLAVFWVVLSRPYRIVRDVSLYLSHQHTASRGSGTSDQVNFASLVYQRQYQYQYQYQ